MKISIFFSCLLIMQIIYLNSNDCIAQIFTNEPISIEKNGLKFESGYFIKTDGKIKKGLIEKQEYYADGFIFIDPADSSKIRIKINNISELSVSGKSYRMFLINNTFYLPLLIDNGKLTLYKEYQKEIEFWSPGTGGINSMGYYYKRAAEMYYFISKGGGEPEIIRKKKFKKNIRYFINDTPELLTKVKNNSITFDQIEELVKTYNATH